ncbi:MAG: bacillithiol biosynthesis BshC [Acidobacteriota bacterium]
MKAPLAEWTALHPAALAYARGELDLPAASSFSGARSPALAEVLAECNRGWGNPVDRVIESWLGGAVAIVTGQQPGLLGGPLLTLVKACAVAAEVKRLRAAGVEAVGFLWLATADDDLPEMGTARVVVGDEILAAREADWVRGVSLAGPATLGPACATLLATLAERLPAAYAQEAVALAAHCYRPGASLGEATGSFLGRLLAGAGVVLVDALAPALAQAAAPAVDVLLGRLPAAWEALRAGERELAARGWPLPLKLNEYILPVFRRESHRRRRLAAAGDDCPTAIRDEHAAHPERFLPNVWLRPLVQDAALGAATAILGGAELAYHIEAMRLWELAGVARPEWRLRPHVTLVTNAERRLIRQLGIEPHHLLHAAPPRHLLAGAGVRRALARLRRTVEREGEALRLVTGAELPALQGDLEATGARLEGALVWLEGRATAAATRAADVEGKRWRRLRAFLRPAGHPQERYLSLLAPLLRLGVSWPQQLVARLDPTDPGMHLLFWEEGEW